MKFLFLIFAVFTQVDGTPYYRRQIVDSVEKAAWEAQGHPDARLYEINLASATVRYVYLPKIKFIGR